MIDRISQYLDNAKLPVTVFLNLSKAFDAMNHEMLIKKLEYYGFTDTSLKWFRSYLHFKSLNLLKLEDIISLNVLKSYYKVCHGNLPVDVTNLFTRNAPGTTHKYDLRPSGIFKTPTVHTCMAERCIRLMLPKIINDTDPSVTEKLNTHRIYEVFESDKDPFLCCSLSDW